MSRLSALRSRASFNNNLFPILTRSFISGIEQSMIGVVFQPFVLSLGASMSLLGFLSGLGGFGGLIPTLVYPWGGWIADQRGRKVVLLGASLAAMGAFAVYAIAGWFAALLIVPAAVILLGISQVYQPINSALVGEAVSEERRGHAFSMSMVAMTVPGIIVPVAAGAVADRFGFTFIFPVAIAFEVAAFVIIWRYLRNTHAPAPKEEGWSSVLRFLRRAWVPPRDLRWFFVSSALDTFAWAMGFGLLFGLLRKEYGFTTTQLGTLAAVSSLTWAIISIPIGRIIDRIGAKPVMVVSEALGIPLMLIWMTQSQFQVFAASMVLFALTAATWLPARAVYVTQTVEPTRRGEIFGRLSAFTSILGFPSAYIGGWLYDHYGFTAPLWGNLIFAGVTCAVLIFLVQAPSKMTRAVTVPAE